MKQTILLITLLMLFATSAFAQIPQTMSYQGVLADEAGNAVADGSYVLNFALYETAEGGTAIWQETQEVAAESGLFNVLLGRVEPLTPDFDHPFWLGITIGSDAELQPRIELASSPYSLQALSVADSAVTGKSIAAGHVVRSLNGARDEVTLMAGENISISAQGQELMISASGILGTDGRNCWDLNGNGQEDPEEDTNGDGDFNAEDCKGDKGDQGDTGDKGDQGNQGDKGDKGAQGSSGTSSWTDGTGKVTTTDQVAIGPGASGSLGSNILRLYIMGSQNALHATSTAGDAVFGSSSSGDGVHGMSNSGFAGRFFGPDNNGTKAAVKISSSGQTMLLDGNEIDATAGSLFLNFNSSGDVVLVRGGGNVVVNTTVVHSSDRRLKKNITTLDDALDKVLNLRGITFEWKKGARNRNPQQGVQIGFVAQEVEAVVPELVKTDSEGYKSVAYANVTALLIEAVKGQQKTIAEQNTQLKELRSRVNKLESQFSQTAMLNK